MWGCEQCNETRADEVSARIIANEFKRRLEATKIINDATIKRLYVAKRRIEYLEEQNRTAAHLISVLQKLCEGGEYTENAVAIANGVALGAAFTK